MQRSCRQEVSKTVDSTQERKLPELKKKSIDFYKYQNFKYPHQIEFSIQGELISVFDTKMHSIIFRICGKQFIFSKE